MEEVKALANSSLSFRYSEAICESLQNLRRPSGGMTNYIKIRFIGLNAYDFCKIQNSVGVNLKYC